MISRQLSKLFEQVFIEGGVEPFSWHKQKVLTFSKKI